jgi:hypothetical protein
MDTLSNRYLVQTGHARIELFRFKVILPLRVTSFVRWKGHMDLYTVSRVAEIGGLIALATTLGGALSLAVLRWRPRVVVSPRLVGAQCALAAAASQLFRLDQPVGSAVVDRVYVAIGVAVVTALCPRARTSVFLGVSGLLTAVMVLGGGDQSNIGLVLTSLVLGALLLLRARKVSVIKTLTTRTARVRAPERATSVPGVELGSAAGSSARAHRARSKARSRSATMIQTLVAPVCAVSLLALPTSLPSRVPTVVASVAVAALFTSWWISLSRPRRNLVAALTAGGLSVVGGVAVGAGIAVSASKRHAESAISLAEMALGSAEGLHTDQARADVDAARREIAVALTDLRSPIARPSQFVPVMGVNMRVTISLLDRATERLILLRSGRPVRRSRSCGRRSTACTMCAHSLSTIRGCWGR